MDIHRSRFVPFPPSAINALAFSHPEADDSNNDPECLRLAIGRANGNIEIWNPANGAWLLEKVFYGGKDRSVEGLVWTQEPNEKDNQNRVIPGRLRLFSIGYSSSITEWDLSTGLPARHSDGNHSEVWCFAAQPRMKTPAKVAPETDRESQKLIAGCADGTVVLLSTENDDLRFERFVSRSSTKKARALSITYKDSHIVLAGFADSMIRVFDTRNGNVLRNISLGSGPHGGPKEILVWKVKCLSNGDFVSGDSTGDIRIYNGKNYSQMQRISGHEADILDLGVSRDGTMIFSAGMDRRTCFYSSKKSAATRGTGGKWRKVSHQRHHEHDVKAMTTYEGNKLSIVVSGGIDTQPIVFPLRQFGKELNRGLPALPHAPPLISAPNARLMISWWNSELRIWRVKSQDDRTEKPKVVARLALQGDENVTSASITQDGSLLAVATANVVKLFQLLQPQTGSGTGLRIRKIEVPTAVGARIVRLSADGKWLTLVTSSNEVLLLRILPPEDESDRHLPLDKIVRLQRHLRPSLARDPLSGPSGEYTRSIVHAEFSSDAKVFAVADLAGDVDTWVVEGHEDPTAPEIECDESVESDAEEDDEEDDENESPKGQVMFLGQRWISNPSGHLLPRLDATPIFLSFQPTTEQPDEPKGNPGVHPTRNNPHPHSHEIPNTQYRLLVVTADHRLNLFDVLTGRLSEWSRRNPPSSYPTPYRLLDLPAKGCVWDTSEGRQRLWLYGEKWLFMFDLSKDFPIPESTDVDMVDGADETSATGSKKRKRELLKDASRKHNTGAGDIIPDKEIPVTKLRKFNSSQIDEPGKQAWTDANDARKNVASDDVEFENSNQSLANLRRSNEQSENNTTGDEVGEVLDHRKTNEPWWHTFKYRPILGMVSIGKVEEGRSPEVVIVERPSWDLDLPPRFVGSHEQ